MINDLLIAIIGSITSVAVAWITTRKGPPKEPVAAVGKTSFLAVLALGLAITALAIGVFSYTETTNAQFEIVQKSFAAHTEGYETDKTLPELPAPRVPDQAQRHVLGIACPGGYHPVAAWHEVKGSHPVLDAMYTIDASVENKEVVLYLRAREGVDGYVYLDIIVLCSRFGS